MRTLLEGSEDSINFRRCINVIPLILFSHNIFLLYCASKCVLLFQKVSQTVYKRGDPLPGPRPTQPSISLGSVNEYQLQLGRQRRVWFIPLVDVRGVCRTVRSLRTRAIPEHFIGVITTKLYANPHLLYLTLPTLAQPFIL